MFPWLAAVPPTVLSDALVLKMTPLISLPSAIVPVKSVPMKFPSMTLSVAVDPSIRIPHSLAEITLLDVDVVPPIVLLGASSINMPSSELPSPRFPSRRLPQNCLRPGCPWPMIR